LYNSDRELRLILFERIEKIEISPDKSCVAKRTAQKDKKNSNRKNPDKQVKKIHCRATINGILSIFITQKFPEYKPVV
jgi:hypothetical protein